MTRERVILAPVGGEPEDRLRIVEAGVNRGFRRFALPPGDDLAVGATLERIEYDGSLLRTSSGARTPITVQEVGDPSELSGLLAQAASSNGVAVRWKGERVLPMETVIAEKTPDVPVWVVTSVPAEVPAALGALEHGVDAVVLEVRDTAELDELVELLESSDIPDLDWQEVTVERVEPAGLGDRILVDTTSLLKPAEGMILGSSAAFLFHVRSEALGSRYTRPRPFRVNAGGPHSYTLLPDGATRYLTELNPGDRILVAGADGVGRTVRVGRIKIERRPMVIVSARYLERTRTVFLQEAETVRVSGPGDVAIPVTELKAGQRILGVALPAGRHLGVAVDESVEER